MGLWSIYNIKEDQLLVIKRERERERFRGKGGSMAHSLALTEHFLQGHALVSPCEKKKEKKRGV